MVVDTNSSPAAAFALTEELKAITIFFDCGTPRIFEDASYKYVFRTQSHATMDSVAAARYVRERFPKATRIAGKDEIKRMALSDPDLQPLWQKIQKL